jgi:hypothetical protein
MKLYVINADGPGLTQITHDGTFHAAPQWSPEDPVRALRALSELRLRNSLGHCLSA